uniref:Uncharacterized protein n=1 Tax=Glossina austeni TaxID=7395 RepID=A0A1A9V9P1_GLOAU
MHFNDDMKSSGWFALYKKPALFSHVVDFAIFGNDFQIELNLLVINFVNNKCRNGGRLILALCLKRSDTRIKDIKNSKERNNEIIKVPTMQLITGHIPYKDLKLKVQD